MASEFICSIGAPYSIPCFDGYLAIHTKWSTNPFPQYPALSWPEVSLRLRHTGIQAWFFLIVQRIDWLLVGTLTLIFRPFRSVINTVISNSMCNRGNLSWSVCSREKFRFLWINFPMENNSVRKCPSVTTPNLIDNGYNQKEERPFHIHVIHSFGFKNPVLNSVAIC